MVWWWAEQLTQGGYVQKGKPQRAEGTPPERPELRYTIVHEGDRVAFRIFETGSGTSKRQRITPHCSVLWRGSANHHTDVGVVLHDPSECIHHLWAQPTVRVIDLVKIVLLHDAKREDAADNLARIGVGFSRVFRWAKRHPMAVVPRKLIGMVLTRETTT